jgi:hypothetical protein
MITAAVVALLVFAALSAVDGLYIHLWRLRLHARPASWAEHGWHTARAVLFVPIVATIFVAPTAGAVLWGGVILVVADQLIEILDVRAERASRADLGGVGGAELATHVALVIARTAAVALALAARPVDAWAVDAAPVIGAYPAHLRGWTAMLIPGGVAVAIVHVVLAWRHRPVAVTA